MGAAINRINRRMARKQRPVAVAPPAVISDIDALDPNFETQAYIGQQGYAPVVNSVYDGEKFFGGYGPTELIYNDYWTLRRRSANLFNTNLYARGIIRRLITNEINTGLTPEAEPDESVLGVQEDSLQDWTELTENRFSVWASTPELCDFEGRRTFGEIQADARQEALVEGDVLAVLRFNRATQAPAVQLISGSHVTTPLGGDDSVRKGNVIKQGVELDKNSRQVAFWVKQKDGTTKRLPAVGERSGRRIAWLVYGTEKRIDDVRGMPLASLMIQSLKEIDRYRDSAQRKAVITSMIAMYIKKTEDKPGTLPITGGAQRKGSVTVTGNEGTKTTRTTSNIPGVVLEELQTGEEPVAMKSDGTDVNFPAFEEAIIATIAWANQIPPEILRLAFSNNYSASQAAINEFKIYLNMFWSFWGNNFCQPVYREWLVNEVLMRRVDAPGLLEAYRDARQTYVVGAWIMAHWYGSIKPSTDPLKQVKASQELIKEGMTTRARESRINTGTKFSKNVKRLAKENEQLASAAVSAPEEVEEVSETLSGPEATIERFLANGS